MSDNKLEMDRISGQISGRIPNIIDINPARYRIYATHSDRPDIRQIMNEINEISVRILKKIVRFINPASDIQLAGSLARPKIRFNIRQYEKGQDIRWAGYLARDKERKRETFPDLKK